MTVVSVGYASIAEAVEEADIEFEVPLVYDEEEDGEQSVILQRDIFGIISDGAGYVWGGLKTVGNAFAGVLTMPK